MRKNTSFLRKNITLPENIFRLLEAEENASRLITDLLRAHYSLNSPIKELKGELEALNRRRAAIEAKLMKTLGGLDYEVRLHEFLRPWIESYRKKQKEGWPPSKLGYPTMTREKWLKEAARQTRLPIEELMRHLEAEK